MKLGWAEMSLCWHEEQIDSLGQLRKLRWRQRAGAVWGQPVTESFPGFRLRTICIQFGVVHILLMDLDCPDQTLALAAHRKWVWTPL